MRAGLLLLTFVVAFGSQPPERASLRVIVVDEKGDPLGGAILMLQGGPPPSAATGVTDTNGTFTFAEVPAASYRLKASCGGRPDVQYVDAAGSPPEGRIALGSGEAATLTVRMPRGGAITGVVADPVGHPMVGQVVIANREGIAPGSGDMTSFHAYTDRLGRYRIGGLPAGAYLIKAYRTTTRSRGNGDSASDDVRVTLSVAEERADINFRLGSLTR